MRSDKGNGSEVFGGLSPLIAAAHELKSPLALIRQLSFSLENPHLSEAERNELLEHIRLTSERALRLTSDLTKASRLEDALFEIEPINPRQLCDDIIHDLQPLFTAHGRVLTVTSRRHPLLLVANRDLLRRIVLNFSDNALHYSEAGAAVELQIKTRKHGQIIRVGVRDYGPALSSDVWRTLQAKLAVAPQAIHARPQSSGLGLYIAGLFANVMNGQIGAIRHRDGATFYVDLQASRQLSLL
jgi:K+-sensing histidine kinase KdpD